MDGCAIMYVVNWPTNAMVQDYVDNMCHFVLNKLKTTDTAIVFDRYYDFSIKSSTRLDRGSTSSRTHLLSLTSPLPAKLVTLSSPCNKVQLIDLICGKLVSMAASMNESHSLLVTGTSPISVEVKHGVIINRNDLLWCNKLIDLFLIMILILLQL